VSGEAITAARTSGRFVSMDDFVRRTHLPQSQVTILADADTFGSLDKARRVALWNAMSVESKPKQQSLFDILEQKDDSAFSLPIMEPKEEVFADYRTTGLSLRSHPLAFHRQEIESFGIIPTDDLRHTANGTLVKVAGLVLLRQRPGSAKGITFVTIEDETGTANLIVHHNTWEHFRSITRHSHAWIVHGQVQSKDSVIHVVVHRVEDLAACLPAVKSRDFR
jgi:error-prone DNA polymerase